jgi:hypothetical protein
MSNTVRTTLSIRGETLLSVKAMADRESIETGRRVSPSDVVQRALDEFLSKAKGSE